MNQLSHFVKTRRKQVGLTQEEFAEKAGVALTVIRKIEQGKENLSLRKSTRYCTCSVMCWAPSARATCDKE